jgi:5,10-methylenetetrahydromethanopterin reductase
MLDSQNAIKTAQKAQQNGFYGVSIPEDAGSSDDALITVAAISQRCENLHFITNLVNHHTRHPVILGMAASTLARLTSGKFALGLGTGAPETLKAMNVQDLHPLAKMKESIAIIRKLIAGEEVIFHGEYFSVSSAKLMRGKRYDVPIYVAAIQETAVRFVSRIADGILLSNCATPRYIGYFSRIINANTAGRKFEVAVLVSYIPTKDKSEGLKLARIITQRYFMFPGIGESLLQKSGYDPTIAAEVRKGNTQRVNEEILESMVVIGSEDKMMDRLQVLEKAGVTLPIITAQPMYLEEVLKLPSNLGIGKP